MLINAIYFFGKWETKFDKQDTKDMDFNVETNKVSVVDGMNIKSEFNQVKLRTAKGEIGVLEMPYRDENFAMYLILPPQGKDIRDFDWADVNLSTVHNQMSRKNTDLRLPKFKIEFGMNMAKIFKEMGVTEAFTPSAGNFHLKSINMHYAPETFKMGS